MLMTKLGQSPLTLISLRLKGLVIEQDLYDIFIEVRILLFFIKIKV